MSESYDAEKIPKLLAELYAIQLWDEYHWRNEHNEEAEIIAFENRRRRRTEILIELGIFSPNQT
jgi:hypothetical protein